MSHAAAPVPMTARRTGPLHGEAPVPGDKSVSHRALILAALTVGETRITGPRLESLEACLRTAILGDGDGAVDRDHRRFRHRQQGVVNRFDRWPI